MAKIKSFGAEVYINGIAVGGVTDIQASGTDVSFIDTSEHDAGTAATGSITFTGLPSVDETIVVRGVTYTFKDSAASATQITIGATKEAAATNTAAKISANDANVHTFASNGVVILTATTRGTAGNAYTLTESATNLTVSGSGTFAGGAAQVSGGFRTFLSGLKDGGTLEITGKYNYADNGQAEWKAEEGVAHAFYIILSDNSGLAFYAIVGGFQTSNPLDDAVEFTATAKITGEVFPVFPTMTITGTLTTDGSTPPTFPALLFAGINEGKTAYTSTGSAIGELDYSYALWWGGTRFSLMDGTAFWYSDSASLIPDEADDWYVEASETGTPIVTGS